MGYKKVINERQEEMGEDNNSFGGYQPTEDRPFVLKISVFHIHRRNRY